MSPGTGGQEGPVLAAGEASLPAPTPDPAAGGKSRVGGIVRWAARLTSVPVLGLVLTSLASALPNFSVAAQDDRLIAAGLCGTCVGLVLGWCWSAIGGGLILASSLLMLAQGDSFLNPDPFALAFGLQGVVFLISAALNFRGGGTAVVRAGWTRKAAVGLLGLVALAVAALLVKGPGPAPITRENEVFVGVWENGAGFSLEITADGNAKVTRAADAKVDDWNSPVPPGGSGVFQVNFLADDQLELAGGFFGSSKTYSIRRRPHAEGKLVRMAINGGDPSKRGSSLTLTKKSP
jgi:hypothetical protein